MKNTSKSWRSTATVLTAVGAILFGGALAAANFDFSRLSTLNFETNTYEFAEDFHNISINVETAKVTFVPSEGGGCRVECVEEANANHSVIVEDGTLEISTINTRKWYHYIGISFRSPSITVYLPKDEYTALSVTTETGSIEIPDRYRFETVSLRGTTANISCYANASDKVEMSTTTGNITLGSLDTGTVKLSVTTGKITASDILCGEITAKSTTGHILLKNVLAKTRLRAENTTGGVTLDDCDADEITVHTSTGSVKGTLRSEKIFVAKSSTGRIRVPDTTSGGKCEIRTSTGSIDIEIE